MEHLYVKFDDRLFRCRMPKQADKRRCKTYPLDCRRRV